MAKSNYEISIKFFFCDIILNSVTIVYGQLNNGIYVVSWPKVIYTSNKYPRIVDVTDAYLWYCRLDHINKNRVNRLDQKKIFDDNDYKSLPTYESCLYKKMINSPFTEKSE